MSIFPVMCVRSGGCAAFPDVCMTPGVSAGAPGPLPYMNLAMPDDGDGKSKVKTMNSNTLVKGSQLSKSTGNQAGNAPGGTVSGVMMGPVKVQSGCDKVKVEGEECAYHTIKTAHNGNNANAPMGGHLTPCGVKVKVIGTPGSPPGSLDTLKAGNFIAVGAGVGGILGPVQGAADPITDAQQSLNCTPSVQQGLANHSPSVSYGYSSVCNPQTHAITIGPGYTGPALSGALAHELGHAVGPTPSDVPLPGETSASAYAARMTNESLQDEARAATRNVQAAQEYDANCPGGPDRPAILGDTNPPSFEGMVNSGNQAGLANHFAGISPNPQALAAQGLPPGATYQQYYGQSYYNWGISQHGLTP